MSMNKKRGVKLACISLAAAVSCGILAGCDLVTSDSAKDMAQVVAEVNISKGEEFQAGKAYEKYANVIPTSVILKRDLISNFLSYGYQYVQSYGQTYEQTFTTIKDNLVKRDMLLQYARVELFETGVYTVEGFQQAVADKSGVDYELASVGYFLTEAEKAKAEYTLKSGLNASLDSQEESFIKADELEYETTVRTTPTGLNTEDEDYCATTYEVYTGRNSAANCGEYEPVEGSTPSTRKKAYNQFLGNLLQNNLISEGEDTSKLEELSYYKSQRVVAYEDALSKKLSDLYEDRAVSDLTQARVEKVYADTLATQKLSYKNVDTFEKSLDSASDTSFVLTAPSASYGYVINILLPFSATQKADLARDSKNLTENEKFIVRANFLKDIKATDQRASWFNGEEDYSYKGADDKYYFFEDSLENNRYERLKNYAGTYAFNGTVTLNEKKGEKRYTVKENKIDIDEFIDILETQLDGALGAGKATGTYSFADKDDYYAQANYFNGDKVDYSKFVYYTGQVTLSDSNSNNVFDATSDANKAMSVVNELSFAYNTDTAGLNTYLGYAVSAYKTSFVPEFEYAAKLAVNGDGNAFAGGVGSYTVAPSEYGWHIMYCTFKFDMTEDAVYTFNWADIEKEGTFSNLYYEALKDSATEGYSSKMQTTITNRYSTCVTLYEDRYSDLFELDNQ